MPMARATLPEYLDVATSATLPVWIDREPVGHLLGGAGARGRRASAAGAVVGRGTRRSDPAARCPGSARNRTRDLAARGGRLAPRPGPPAGSRGADRRAGARREGGGRRHPPPPPRARVGRGGRRGARRRDGRRTDPRRTPSSSATGPWSTALLDPIGIRLPVSGARGWIVRTAASNEPLRHLIEHAGWRDAPERLAAVARPSAARVATDAVPRAEVGAILHLHPDGTVLVGSSRQAWITPEPEDPSVPRRQLAAAIALVPSLAETRVLSTWWGLRPITPDERPIVGMVRDGLVVATGHGSEGVILGAGTAKLVTSIVLGGPATVRRGAVRSVPFRPAVTPADQRAAQTARPLHHRQHAVDRHRVQRVPVAADDGLGRDAARSRRLPRSPRSSPRTARRGATARRDARRRPRGRPRPGRRSAPGSGSPSRTRASARPIRWTPSNPSARGPCPRAARRGAAGAAGAARPWRRSRRTSPPMCSTGIRSVICSPTRTPSIRRSGRIAEVREHQGPHRVRAGIGREHTRGRADPPLKSKHCMPVPAPTQPSDTAPSTAPSSAAATSSSASGNDSTSLRSESSHSETTGIDLGAGRGVARRRATSPWRRTPSRSRGSRSARSATSRRPTRRSG